jgi:hypothetical protein
MANKMSGQDDRRVTNGEDRRESGRGGRRSSERHRRWARIGWLFASYALLLSARNMSKHVHFLGGRPIK